MLKPIITAIALTLTSTQLIAANQTFSVDAAQSTITVQTIDILGVQGDNSNIASSPIDAAGNFIVDIGTPTEGTPKTWNVTADLKHPFDAGVFINTANTMQLIGGGFTIDVFSISLFGFDNQDLTSSTLTGGPAISAGTQTTDVDFLADGTATHITFGTTSLPSRAFSDPVVWNIQVADADQLGMGALGNLGIHITATALFPLLANNLAAGQFKVDIDLYGFTTYTGTVNSIAVAPTPATTTSTSGALSGFSLMLFASLLLCRRLKTA